MLAISSKLDTDIKLKIPPHNKVRGILFKDLAEHLNSILLQFTENTRLVSYINNSNAPSTIKIITFEQILQRYLQDYWTRVFYHYIYIHNNNHAQCNIDTLRIERSPTLSINSTFIEYLRNLNTSKCYHFKLAGSSISQEYKLGISLNTYFTTSIDANPEDYIVNSLEFDYAKVFNVKDILLQIPIYTSIMDIITETSLTKNSIISSSFYDKCTSAEKEIIDNYILKTQINTNIATPVLGDAEFNNSSTLGKAIRKVADSATAETKKRKSRKKPPLLDIIVE